MFHFPGEATIEWLYFSGKKVPETINYTPLFGRVN